jgi:hypothetical protein
MPVKFCDGKPKFCEGKPAFGECGTACEIIIRSEMLKSDGSTVPYQPTLYGNTDANPTVWVDLRAILPTGNFVEAGPPALSASPFYIGIASGITVPTSSGTTAGSFYYWWSLPDITEVDFAALGWTLADFKYLITVTNPNSTASICVNGVTVLAGDAYQFDVPAADFFKGFDNGYQDGLTQTGLLVEIACEACVPS